jgi:hypothetical protein
MNNNQILNKLIESIQDMSKVEDKMLNFERENQKKGVNYNENQKKYQ